MLALCADKKNGDSFLLSCAPYCDADGDAMLVALANVQSTPFLHFTAVFIALCAICRLMKQMPRRCFKKRYTKSVGELMTNSSDGFVALEDFHSSTRFGEQ